MSANNWVIPYGIAVDSLGDVYVTGTTHSRKFPTTEGALQPVYGGGFRDGFVAKLNSTGSELLYSTYLGGSDADQALDIAVDSSGSAYVAGETSSTDFPSTAESFDPSFNGEVDAFVGKLSSSGSSLTYATYIGGTGRDLARAIAVDASGRAFVTGTGVSVTRVSAAGDEVITYRDAVGADVALDASGSVYVAGGSSVAKLNPLLTDLEYSTSVRGSVFGSSIEGIAVDAAGNAYLTGEVRVDDFPITSNAFQRNKGGGGDSFLTKLNAAGDSILFSTYLLSLA